MEIYRKKEDFDPENIEDVFFETPKEDRYFFFFTQIFICLNFGAFLSNILNLDSKSSSTVLESPNLNSFKFRKKNIRNIKIRNTKLF